MRRRRQGRWGVALIIVGAAGVLGYLFGTAAGVFGNADRSQHLAGNEALLDQVPLYPGARYRTTWTFESKDNNGWPEGLGPITSYNTERVYALDEAAPAGPAVIYRWYRSRLAGKCQFKGGGSYRCGNGGIYIQPYEGGTSFTISADYDHYDK